MFRYEVQFLGRNPGDFERQMRAVAGVPVIGKVGYKSYFFAGVKGLVVLLETEADCRAVQRAVPSMDVIGAWERPTPLPRADLPRRLAA